jgi:glycosyltransferase involved in cell wall biosynthesis
LIAGDPYIKGVGTFLEAVALVRARRDDVEFLIIGSREAPTALVTKAGKLGVTWIDRLPRRELLDSVLPSLTALAYPSRFDGSPYVVLEALASGVPVLTSDYFALPEIVGNGIGGQVHPLGDASCLAEQMVSILNPSFRAVMSENARGLHARRYDTDAAHADLLSVYLAVLGQDAPAGLRSRAIS